MAAQDEEPGRDRTDEGEEPEVPRHEEAEPEAEEARSEGEAEEGTDEDEAESRSGSGWSLKRLSGPQACLGIVGCGTLAAVVVVALVFGGVQLIAGAFTSDEPEDVPAGQVPDWTPPESMEDGALNLCTTLDTSGETGNFTAFGPERADSGENYLDQEHADGYRLVADECQWNLRAEDWTLTLSYEAYVALRENTSPQELASERYDEWANAADGGIARTFGVESIDGGGDDSEVVFGVDDREDSGLRYTYLSRVNGTLFEISISAKAEEAEAAELEADFRGIVHSLDPVLTTRIERIVPE